MAAPMNQFVDEDRKNPLEGMNKKERLAAFLVVLGPEVGATILNHFEEKEVEEISKAMVDLDFVPEAMRKALVREFSDVCFEAITSKAGGPQFTRNILERAIGSFKASEVIRRVAPNRPHSIDTSILRDIHPRSLINLLRKEQIQTWALVLSYLEPSRCAEVLAIVSPEMRTDIVERIATMEPTSAEVVEQVLRHIEKISNLRGNQDVTSSGGTKILADILNTLDDSTSKQILSSLEERNPELSRSVKKLLFTFEEIGSLDKASLGKLLREIDFHILAVALKTASEQLKQLIIGSLTKRAAEIINEEIQYMPPVRLAEVEQAQEQIIEQMRRLEASGEIVRSRGGESNAVV